MIRAVCADDSEQIADIYNHYVNTTVITFEETPVSAAEMLQRANSILAAGLPWLVAEEAPGRIIGYAYASKWKERTAYRHSVESSIYLHPACTGRGKGTSLYAALMQELRSLPVHTVLGGIALPNEASIALHEKMGMSKVAHLSEVGFKFGRWIDVAYWQLQLKN